MATVSTTIDSTGRTQLNMPPGQLPIEMAITGTLGTTNVFEVSYEDSPAVGTDGDWFTTGDSSLDTLTTGVYPLNLRASTLAINVTGGSPDFTVYLVNK